MEELLKNLLASDTETEVLEFKKAEKQFDKNKLGKYFSALSNEANLEGLEAAYLVFGVNDNKVISGTKITENQVNDYKHEIGSHTSPIIGFTKVSAIQTDQGRVLLFKIPAAPQGMPIAWKGHYYARNGESLTALNIEKVERIRNQVSKSDWSARIIEDAIIEDLDVTAIQKAREMFAIKNPNLKESIADWDDATFLNKAKITIQGKITNTAILLLGKSESEHFLSPATSKMSWILRDKDGISKDYQHFFCPIILEAERLKSKIRILKYRYIRGNSLFPDEVDQYDPYVIRETLNNCIVHQDYTLGGKVNVVEREDGELVFSNSGNFIPETIWNVLESNSPTVRYRNPHLANAMVNLNMIDTIGSGIIKIFKIQKERFFPLPDYSFKNRQVEVQVYGKILNLAFAEKLASDRNLTLKEIFLLDRVAKGKSIEDKQVKELRKKKLIEGRKPNYMLSSSVAEIVGEKANYIKQRGFKDSHYKKMIVEFIGEYSVATKKDIDKLLLDILPKVLDDNQKANKIRNIVYSMSKKDQSIKNIGSTRYPKWVLSSSKINEIK